MPGSSPIAGLPYALLADVPDANVATQSLTTALDHLVLAKYATVAARNTANPTPAAGDMCYVTGTNIYYNYNGTAWVGMKPQTSIVASDQLVTNSATLVTATNLTMNLESSSSYIIDYHIRCGSTASAAGYKTNFVSAQTPGTGSVIMWQADGDAAGGTTQTAATVLLAGNALATGNPFNMASPAPAWLYLQVHLLINTTSTASQSVSFQFAQVTATSSNSVQVNAGSHVICWKVG